MKDLVEFWNVIPDISPEEIAELDRWLNADNVFKESVKSLYTGHEDAHGWSHIMAVKRAARSLTNNLMTEAEAIVLWCSGLEEAILLHDIGRALPGDEHESLGADMIADTPWIMQYLGDKASRVIEAVRCHRASTPYEGDDMLVKILRDADRLSAFLDGDPSITLARAISYGKYRNPELSEEEQVARAKAHQWSKYGPSGYGMKGIHFPITRKKIEETVAKLFV